MGMHTKRSVDALLEPLDKDINRAIENLSLGTTNGNELITVVDTMRHLLAEIIMHTGYLAPTSAVRSFGASTPNDSDEDDIALNRAYDALMQLKALLQAEQPWTLAVSPSEGFSYLLLPSPDAEDDAPCLWFAMHLPDGKTDFADMSYVIDKGSLRGWVQDDAYYNAVTDQITDWLLHPTLVELSPEQLEVVVAQHGNAGNAAIVPTRVNAGRLIREKAEYRRVTTRVTDAVALVTAQLQKQPLWTAALDLCGDQFCWLMASSWGEQSLWIAPRNLAGYGPEFESMDVVGDPDTLENWYLAGTDLDAFADDLLAWLDAPTTTNFTDEEIVAAECALSAIDPPLDE